MRIAIVGGSSQMAEQLTKKALELGWGVNLLVREPKLSRRASPLFAVFKDDPANTAGAEAALMGVSAVVLAMDASEAGHVSTVARVVATLDKRKRPCRVLYLSELGVGDSRRQALQTSALFPKLKLSTRSGVHRNLAAAEDVLRSSHHPYAIIRLARLSDDMLGRAVIAVGAGEPPPGRVAAADAARFVLSLLSDGELKHRELTVGTRSDREQAGSGWWKSAARLLRISGSSNDETSDPGSRA
jgi:uncharacterized protein YbjT (DUF2867 family)